MTSCQREVNLEGFITECGAPISTLQACPFAQPDCFPGQIIFVIAPDHQWFETWCVCDCDPRENAHDRKWRVITGPEDAYRLRKGRPKREGDKILLLGTPRHAGEVLDVIRQSLMPCGFTEYETDDGKKHPL